MASQGFLGRSVAGSCTTFGVGGRAPHGRIGRVHVHHSYSLSSVKSFSGHRSDVRAVSPETQSCAANAIRSRANARMSEGARRSPKDVCEIARRTFESGETCLRLKRW